MKTFKTYLNELNLAQRKAIGRRLAMMSKKASTQKKKERNKLKAWPANIILKKAQKKVRQFVMKKIAGKERDLSDLGLAAKERLEKQADKKMKGGKMKGMVKKMAKQIQTKHKEDIKKAKEDQKEDIKKAREDQFMGKQV